MTEAADPRFAPPTAHVEDMGVPGAVQEPGGRGMRLLAAVADGLLMAVLAGLLLLLPMFEQLSQESSRVWRFGSDAVGIVLFLVVQSWPLVARGQTLGKMMCGLRIVRTDGSRASAWRLIGLRYGAGLLANLNLVISSIYFLIDSLLIFRESRKCLHDTIADTMVIKVNKAVPL